MHSSVVPRELHYISGDTDSGENDVGTHLVTQRRDGQVEAHLIQAGPHLTALLSKVPWKGGLPEVTICAKLPYFRRRLNWLPLIFAKTLQLTGMSVSHEVEVKLRPTCFTDSGATRELR